MKYLFLLLFILQLHPNYGQLIYNEWGEIVPFSQSEKYGEDIHCDDIHTLILPAYNCDSLFLATNPGKTRNTAGTSFCAGFGIDTTINILKEGKSFHIDEGTLWIYTIESPTAWGFSVQFNETIIPEGAYLGFLTEKYFGDDPVFVSNKDFQSEYFKPEEISMGFVRGHRMTIEYFNLNDSIKNNEVIINRITFYYAGLFDPRIAKAQYEIEMKYAKDSLLFDPSSVKKKME